jgi:iron complex outermembrane receptor protein
MDWGWRRDSVMVEGDWRRVDSIIPNFEYQRGSNPGVHADPGGGAAGFGLARWTRATRFAGERSVQTHFERSRMDAGLLAVDLTTWDADVQQTAGFPGGHHVIAGGGVRSNSLRSSSTHGLRFEPPRATYHTFNGFLQDDWHLQRDRLVLTLGAKLEHYDRVGVMAQPSARLLWAPGKRHVYWASYARAARTPSHSDYAMRLAIGIPGTPLELELLGNPAVRPEILISTEAGGRWQLIRKLAADVSVFWYRYSGLHSFLLDQERIDFVTMRIPGRTVNGMNGRNRGGEAVAYLDVRPGWQVVGSYSALFEGRQQADAYRTQVLFTLPYYTPRHQAQVRSAWDLGRRWMLDAGVSRIGRLAGTSAGAYQRVDFRLARKVGEWGEVSVSGQNLLPPRQEFAGDLVFPTGASRRVWEIGFTRRF